MANYVTYPLNTSGRPDGTPPVADKEGDIITNTVIRGQARQLLQRLIFVMQ